MIGMWLFGDLFKLYYYNSTESPLQLILCSFFQCTTDCAILTQFWIYREKNAQMTAKIAALQKAANEKQGKRLPSMLQVNGDMMAAAGVIEHTQNSSIELDYYGNDIKPEKDDALRPLSPHLVTLEEEANSAFTKKVLHNADTTPSHSTRSLASTITLVSQHSSGEKLRNDHSS